MSYQIILGTGKKKMETEIKALDKKFPESVKGIAKFSPRLAHLITAGADLMLVPSRFEPCGLIQLHAMQYGTVPIVASTGGLVDTVKEGKTGFHIGGLNPDKLLEKDSDAIAQTVSRAASVFATPVFKDLVHNCIDQDLSWKKPAKKWEAVIEEVLDGSNSAASGKKTSIKTPVAEIPST